MIKSSDESLNQNCSTILNEHIAERLRTLWIILKEKLRRINIPVLRRCFTCHYKLTLEIMFNIFNNQEPQKQPIANTFSKLRKTLCKILATHDEYRRVDFRLWEVLLIIRKIDALEWRVKFLEKQLNK